MEGITESKEVIEVVNQLGVFIKKAKADGEINWWDLPSAGPLLLAINRAVQGAEKIPSEIKDLTPEESSELITNALNAVYALVQAFVSK